MNRISETADPATPDRAALETAFAAQRRRLLGLAYRMLGSRADAEDIVQETWLRVSAATADVINAEAYLVTVATRLCLDQLKSARARRETYIGPWLPEPVLSTDAFSPATATALADDLSFALMMTLETLSPPERAAFLLHDVFDLPFTEIAPTLGKSEAACRQLAARARKAVQRPRPARTVPAEAYRDLNLRFFETLQTGDLEGLKRLLRDEVVMYSDGGGARLAALNPIHGADRVARFFLGITRKLGPQAASVRLSGADINGRPGILVFLDGQLDQTFSIDVEGGRIAAIYMVRNPLKLDSLDPPQEGSFFDAVLTVEEDASRA